jgi:hypothetical protein
MTFSEYIIRERSKTFYTMSLVDISKSNTTLEEWFPELYYDYCLLKDLL